MVGTALRAFAHPCIENQIQRRQFTRKVVAGLPVERRGKAGIGKDDRPGGEPAEHPGAAGTIVCIRHMNEFLPDRRGIGVVARRLRAEDAEVDRDQDRAEAIVGLDLMCPGQAD